ncbi:MAG: hypothetical protein IH973_15340 [Myxococcales bacterium]|nr:hypothetical protein [Myxococcales bacterium]
MSQINAEQRRAHYQAGQAVVCITLFGARVIKNIAISKNPDDTSGIETYSRLPVPLSCRPPTHRRGEDRRPIAVEGIVDGHGVLAYSGLAAVYECLRAVGESEEFDYRDADHAAREGLSKLASSIGLERPSDHFYEEYWNEALRLLETHWETVERVAEALVIHQTLNGNRVDELILGDDNP